MATAKSQTRVSVMLHRPDETNKERMTITEFNNPAHPETGTNTNHFFVLRIDELEIYMDPEDVYELFGVVHDAVENSRPSTADIS